jgi:putative PIN family toxin of toxin-antitoxin system
MRVVVDTNVWISGLFWKGPPWHILRLAEEGRIEIWATVSMLEELEAVLGYPRLQPRRLELGLEIADLMAYAAALVLLADLPRLEPVIAVDPDDDVFVNCAATVGARYLVSGDRHLQELAEWQGIHIVGPQAFLEREFSHLLGN